MARRIGDVDEFEFVPIGKNHNQGVSCPPCVFLSGLPMKSNFFLDEAEWLQQMYHHHSQTQDL